MNGDGTSPYHNQIAAEQLLQGINAMQMQAGLMPGNGYGGGASPMMPLPRPPMPADFSSNIRVNFSSMASPSYAALPMPAQMGGGITPMQHTYMPAFLPPPPTPNQFSMGIGMDARRRAADQVNTGLAFGQNMMGLGARAMGNLGAFALGGPLGMVGFEALGLGQSFSNMGSSMMNPFIQRRREDLQTQADFQFIRGGQDLSSMGMGLSATAASRLRSNLHQMGTSSDFRSQTYGMFNASDVQRITRISSQLGMLDQSQTADQISGEVRKISRALANFIRIAEEPDMRRALGMMSGLRTMGYSTGEMTTAALQARHFARMAGTDVGGILDAGMRGSAAYTARGLSGAAGVSAGMAASGMAHQLGSLMSPNRLALAGGVEGLTATLTEGAASTTTLGAILPALLTGGGPGGRLRVDRASVRDLMSGRLNLSQLMQRSGGRAQRFGATGMAEIVSRQAELQDELSRTLTPEENVLMPLILANSARTMMPGLGLRERLMAVSGMSETGASAYARMVRDPRFVENMVQQSQVRAREEMRELSGRVESREAYATIPAWVRNLERSFEHLSHSMSRGADRISAAFGRSQDVLEGIAAVGGSANVERIIGSSGLTFAGTAITRERAREIMEDPASAGRMRRIGTSLLSGMERNIREERENYDTTRFLRGVTRIGGAVATVATMGAGLGVALGAGAGSYAAGSLAESYGSEGMTMPFTGTRSRFVAETLHEGEGLGTRMANYFIGGTGYSPAEVERRGNELIRSGLMLERAREAEALPGIAESRSRARTALTEAGVTRSEDRERIRRAGARAHTEYFRGRTGAFGSRTERFNEAEHREAVISGMMNAGITREQATALFNNEDFRGGVIRTGYAGMSDQERAHSDAIISLGGRTSRAMTAEAISAMAQDTEARANATFESVGLGQSFFGFAGASDAGRSAIGELLASARSAGNVSQEEINLALAQRAVEAAGDTPEARRLRAELASRAEELGVDLTEANRFIDERNIDQDTLSRMGAGLVREEGTVGGVMRRLERAETGMEDVALRQAGEGMMRLFGRNAASDILGNMGNFEAQYQALRNRILNGETIGGLTAEGEAAIRGDETGAGEGGRVVRGMINASVAMGRGGVSVEGGGAEGTLAHARLTGEGVQAFMAAMENVEGMDIEELSDAMSGTEGAVVPTPRTFEEAVGVFGTASQALLDAARALTGRAEFNALNNTVT